MVNQPVKVTLSVNKSGDNSIDLIATDDGKLIIQAVLYGQRADGTLIPIQVTATGKLVVKIQPND